MTQMVPAADGSGPKGGIPAEWLRPHDDLKWMRSVLVHKIDGLSECDIRRRLMTTGTHLLELVKHAPL